MALTSRERLYEVLIRYNADSAGAVTVAAHQKSIREIVDTGVVVSATEMNPTPLSAPDLASVMSDQVPTLTNLLAEANATIDALRAQIAGLDS